MILDQLLTYVRLTDDDVARLRGLHDRLAPYFQDIAAQFYVAVWANPGAAAVLSGPAQVERLRAALVDWMSSGLRGPYDDAFNEKRARIGRRHVQIGLAQHYMFTAMNVARGAYLDRIAELYPPVEAIAVVRSVDKLFDVELALMLRHYQLDSEEKLVAREHQIQADRVAALQTMTAGLAHEVRNPLNAAKLQLELLGRRLRRQADDPKLTEPVDLAHHEIARLTAMLNEFLAFAGPPDLHASAHDVVTIARQVIELEHPLAMLSGTSLVLEASSEPTFATVDPAKLHQILQNLVRNALEAAAPGGSVAVSIAVDQVKLRVRVSDSGPGIPDAVRARIYEPFFSTKEGGTGMGMSIVHNFVAMHAGEIAIETSPRGTVIDVTLPLTSPVPQPRAPRRVPAS